MNNLWPKSRWLVVLITTLCGLNPAFLLHAAILGSREYHHQIWQAEDGLPHPNVRSIMQAHDGYLWLATQEGVARFDGMRMIVFDRKTVTEMKERLFIPLVETSDGSIWTATGEGLSRFLGGTTSRYTVEDGLLDPYVLVVHEDSRGVIRAGTARGLCRFADGRFIREEGFIEEAVRAICEDKEGNLWIGTAVGVNRLKNGHVETYTTDELLLGHAEFERLDRSELLPEADREKRNAVQCILEGRDGIWIGTSGGLVRLGEGPARLHTLEDGLSHSVVRCLHEDRLGKLWVGSHGPLQQFVDGKFETLAIKGPQAADFGSVVPGFPYTIFEDREGNVWVGTTFGLNRLKIPKFRTFTTDDGLTRNDISSVCDSHTGDIWVGTWGGGLNRLGMDGVQTWSTRDGLSSNHILSIYEDRRGDLWVGTDFNGLIRFRGGELQYFTTLTGLVDDSVKVIYEDRDGVLWFGGPSGMSRYEDGVMTPFSSQARLALHTIKTILKDRTGVLWIGTKDGLVQYKDGAARTYTTRDGLSGDMINALHEDSEGVLWIGTELAGLTRLKEGRFTSFVRAQGVFAERIINILEDERGNLWLGSRNGVFRAGKKDLDDFAEGRTSSIQVVSYGKLDGMRSAQCNGIAQPSGWKARDGRFWYATINGVCVVSPDETGDPAGQLPPTVVLEEMLVNGAPVHLEGHTRRIPPGADFVEFHFTGMDFAAPEKVHFKCKLEGQDKDWENVGTRRMMHYTNLRPGDYRFHVIACNSEGIWSESGASLAFVIAPHFYQTYWFYAACVFGLVLSGGGVFQARVRRIRQREQRLVVLVSERTRELQQEVAERKQAEDALRLSQEIVLRQERLAAVGQLAAGVAHEFNNILTIIQGHTALLMGDGEAGNDAQESLVQISLGADRAARLTRQMLAFSRKQFMQPQTLELKGIVVQVVEMLGRLLGEPISLQCDFGCDLPPVKVDPGMMEQVIINLAINARDAMPQGGRLTISTSAVTLTSGDLQAHPEARPGRFVCLTVSDNGCGMDAATVSRIFEPFFTTKDVGKGTGLGLASVYGIIKQHQGWIEVASAPGKGSTFRIFLPPANDAPQTVVPTVAVLPPANAGGRETLFVVEDEAPLRALVRSVLQRQGYRVIEAASGAEAMQVWEQCQEPVDLLLTDMVMPGEISGRDLAGRLRTRSPDLKVIYTSGHSHEILSEELHLRAGLSFLAKPYHPARLVQAVRECLDKRESSLK